ncbi:hypothetical protein WJX79_003759 [Trebouxia sp. C0005]
MFRPAAGSTYNSSTSFSHLKDTLFGKDSWAVSELQQQVADLKLEKEQLLKAVTEQQHDAACLAEHVAQIGQLKQVLANLQQHNAELETGSKLRTEERSTTRPSSPEVESLEAQVGQLQSRLMYMEEEKARLVAAAKGKNEQVSALEQRCQKLELEVQKLAQTWSEAAPAEEIKVARQGSMAEQQMHQQQLKALHDDLQAVREQYSADAESWSSQQAALQADLAALAAQTALKSLALDAMMRNSSRASQALGGHAVGGPLWQQDQETLAQALVAEKEWLDTLTHQLAEVQGSLKQSDTQATSQQSPSAALHLPGRDTTAIWESPTLAQQTAPADDDSVIEYTIPAAVGFQSTVIGTEAADNEDGRPFVLPRSAADARIEAPARLQLTLGVELADDDHHLVHEQHHRQQRYTSSDIDFSPVSAKISLAVGSQPGSKRTTRSTRDDETSWTLLSHKAGSDVDSTPVPLGEAPVGTLAGDATALMKGVFAAGTGSVFLTEGPGAQPGDEPMYRVYRTKEADVSQPASAKQSLKQALHAQ